MIGYSQRADTARFLQREAANSFDHHNCVRIGWLADPLRYAEH